MQKRDKFTETVLNFFIILSDLGGRKKISSIYGDRGGGDVNPKAAIESQVFQTSSFREGSNEIFIKKNVP